MTCPERADLTLPAACKACREEEGGQGRIKIRKWRFYRHFRIFG